MHVVLMRGLSQLVPYQQSVPIDLCGSLLDGMLRTATSETCQRLISISPT